MKGRSRCEDLTVFNLYNCVELQTECEFNHFTRLLRAVVAAFKPVRPNAIVNTWGSGTL